MKRMITKQMRDSFNLSQDSIIFAWCKSDTLSLSKVADKLDAAKKQRILILRRTIK